MTNRTLDEDTYHAVRQYFVGARSSLNSWCVANGICFPTAKAALTRYNRSPAAAALRARLLKVTGLEENAE